MAGQNKKNMSAEEHLEILRARPIIEFVGGPMDGRCLPLADHCNLLGFRVDSSDGAVSVIDTYAHDLDDRLKFRYQGRTLMSECPNVTIVDKTDVKPGKPKATEDRPGGGDTTSQ